MLAEKGVEFERRDFFKEQFTVQELKDLLNEIGMKPSEILSKRSKAYKDLGLGNRDLSEDELLDLMTEHPTLLRRPILVRDGRSVIGFNKDKIEALID